MRDAQHQLGARRWLCQLWFLWCLLAICVVPRAVLAFCAGNSLRIEDALARTCDATDVRQSPHGCSVTTSSHDAKHLPHARGTSHACEHAFAGEVEPPQAISSTIDVVARLLTAPRMARVGAPLHLGMPKDLVASDGAIAWSATHSAYGRVIATYADDTARSRYGTAINSPFRLLGQVADDDAELCFTRYRCFDPEIGSWISTDPLEIAGGLNLYGFDGAPTDVVDPLGLAAQTGPAGHGGYAIVHHYPPFPGDTDDRFGHYSVTVVSGDRSQLSHQVMTSEDRSTTTVTSRPSSRTPDKETRIELPDADSALAYQQSQMGQELGPYSKKSNSCVDHVANVLRAGGADVPQSAHGQYGYLRQRGV